MEDHVQIGLGWQAQLLTPHSTTCVKMKIFIFVKRSEVGERLQALARESKDSSECNRSDGELILARANPKIGTWWIPPMISAGGRRYFLCVLC